MTTATPTAERPANSDLAIGTTVRGRIARISSTWSPEERARRALAGRIRREQLYAALGLDTRKVCA